MKTALQELIEALNQLKIASLNSESKRSGDYRIGLSLAISQVQSLLPKEKEQIVKAYDQCSTDDISFSNLSYEYENSKMTYAEYIEKQSECVIDGEQYFKNTYEKL